MKRGQKLKVSCENLDYEQLWHIDILLRSHCRIQLQIRIAGQCKRPGAYGFEKLEMETGNLQNSVVVVVGTG